MARLAHAAVFLSVFLAAIALITVCPAGPAAAAPGTAAEEKEARELFRKAEMSFNMGKFADALGDYQAAYQAKPLPAFLFNIAQCYRNLQDYEKARFFYRRYLALDPHTTNRRLVEDLVAEMTKLIDKSEAAKAAEAKAAEAKAAEAKAVEAKTAEAKTVDATPPPPAETMSPPAAEPNPAPPPAAVVVQAPAPEAPVVEPAPPVYKRWWFWTLVGVVALGAAGATWAATRGDSTPSGSLGTINGR